MQFGGDPINSGKQEQDGDSPWTLHCEFGPQGDGTQGLSIYCGTWAAIYQMKVLFLLLKIKKNVITMNAYVYYNIL